MSSTPMVSIMGVPYRRYAYRYNAKKERGTSMEVFARNENHKGAMMNV